MKPCPSSSATAVQREGQRWRELLVPPHRAWTPQAAGPQAVASLLVSSAQRRRTAHPPGIQPGWLGLTLTPGQATKLETWVRLRGFAWLPRPALDRGEQTVFEKEV